MLSFAVINQSKKVKNADLISIIGACNFQLGNHIAPAWNLIAPKIVFVESLSQVPAGAIVGAIIDNPDIQGALGYHDLTPQGQPYFRVFVDPTLNNGGTVMVGANSISQTISHEIAEATVNPLIYSWADDAGAGLIAQEIGDPVENDTYTLAYLGKNVAVSNFVLPSWFSVRGKAPFDYMHKLTRPRTMTRGGYTIVARVSGEGQKFAKDVEFNTPEEAADYPAWKTALKLAPGSRTFKYIK